MRTVTRFVVVVAALLTLAGCATTQNVQLATQTPQKSFATAALVPQDGNSAAMDGHVRTALLRKGLNVKAPLPVGTRQSSDVDLIVTYVDVWRWDLAMYLSSVDVQLFDAATGNLVALGRWKDSPLHGFRDHASVVGGLMDEVLTKAGVGMRTTAAAR